jgi:hypothetical protein
VRHLILVVTHGLEYNEDVEVKMVTIATNGAIVRLKVRTWPGRAIVTSRADMIFSV